jgi:hypothetical protein
MKTEALPVQGMAIPSARNSVPIWQVFVISLLLHGCGDLV